MTKLKGKVIVCLLLNFQIATLRAEEITLEVHAGQVSHRISRYLTGACIEDVNHEIYGGIYSQMIYGESFAEPGRTNGPAEGVSQMWQPLQRGTAEGNFSIETTDPFTGAQSQRMTFTGGAGELGVENQGLDHWGMNFVKGRGYEGCICVRSDRPAELFVALESRDGAQVYAERRLRIRNSNWQRVNFKLEPNKTDNDGSFVIKLKQPGSIVVGYAFLEPDGWGRFHRLPVRKDVAEGLVRQGITVLRMGGSMVLSPEYRWKNMIGPRASRPPYNGFWHPYTSDGWGIIDFLNFCEAAGFLGIPDVNIDETPKDMADFVDYVNGSKKSVWGARRAASGHPQPYHLKYIELGNEERVDDVYFKKFKSLTETIWSKDTNIIPVVAGGGPADEKILQLAKQHHREVWFDAHIWTIGPRPDDTGLWDFIKSLDRDANGAKYRVVIFELNADNHSQRRALANAAATIDIERNGEIPIVCSANCLQPDGQNDNGWDQGLLFLNPSRVWLQPPGYVTRMISKNYQPLLVESEFQGAGTNLDAAAIGSEDGKTLALQIVNFTGQNTPVSIHLDGFTPSSRTAEVEELSAPLDAKNTADSPDRVAPVKKLWQPDFVDDQASYTFPPYSFTIIKLR